MKIPIDRSVRCRDCGNFGVLAPERVLCPRCFLDAMNELFLLGEAEELLTGNEREEGPSDE